MTHPEHNHQYNLVSWGVGRGNLISSLGDWISASTHPLIAGQTRLKLHKKFSGEEEIRRGILLAM